MHHMRMIVNDRYRPGNQFLDVPQVFSFFLVTKGKSGTAGAGPAGPAYTVNVCFGHIWQFIVDDMRQIIDVDTPGRNIRRHQDPRMPGLEIFKRPLPGILRFVAMNGLCPDARPHQSLGYLIGAMFGTREDKRRANRVVLQDMQ